MQTNQMVLQRIADALGVPVERFFTDISPTDTDECMRLWFMIRTQEGRRQALEALRKIANDDLT